MISVDGDMNLDSNNLGTGAPRFDRLIEYHIPELCLMQTSARCPYIHQDEQPPGPPAHIKLSTQLWIELGCYTEVRA